MTDFILDGILKKASEAAVRSDTQAREVYVNNWPGTLEDIETDIEGFQATNHTDLIAVKEAIENMNINVGNLTVDITDSQADNTEGAISILVQDASANVVTYTVSSSYKLKGFSATGTADALIKLKVNDATKLVGRINIVNLNCMMVLPDPIYLNDGDIVNLEINNCGSDSGAYDGVIIGE